MRKFSLLTIGLFLNLIVKAQDKAGAYPLSLTMLISASGLLAMALPIPQSNNETVKNNRYWE
ncbi:hypothetical protein [Pedobacter sp.]|uniref:hypothetical protein n=1 Tax=Pedobacter sp. TaxID=1411316 RepID=UPI0031D03C28